MKTHPIIQAYEDLFEAYTSDDPPGIPYADNPVQRARLETECKRRGIDLRENFLEEMELFERIGLFKRVKQLCRKRRQTHKPID